MGKQVYIDLAVLLDAGCVVKLAPADKRTGTEAYAVITFPGSRNDSAFGMSVDLFDNNIRLYCDYNEWGSNRKVLAPFIALHELKHDIY